MLIREEYNINVLRVISVGSDFHVESKAWLKYKNQTKYLFVLWGSFIGLEKDRKTIWGVEMIDCKWQKRGLPTASQCDLCLLVSFVLFIYSCICYHDFYFHESLYGYSLIFYKLRADLDVVISNLLIWTGMKGRKHTDFEWFLVYLCFNLFSNVLHLVTSDTSNFSCSNYVND